MSVYVALLRGINVSGVKPVPMADLKKMFESSGFKNVKTYIQSGNVVFSSPTKSNASLAGVIEAAIAKKFGFEVPVIVRSLVELEKLNVANPYFKRKASGVERSHVTLLAEAPAQAGMEKLAVQAPKGPDEFHFSPGGTEIYLWCRSGYGKTALSIAFFERVLGVKATTRNLETLNSLLELGRAV